MRKEKIITGKELIMKISIFNEFNELQDIELEKNEKADGINWEYIRDSTQIKIVTDAGGKEVINIYKSPNILEAESVIKQKFLDQVFELRMTRIISEEDGFDEALEDECETVKIDPYDPKLIRVDPKQFPIFQVNQMINEKEIDLSPDFQRGFVWTDITRKSRLIESLLLRIPLPVFYLAQDYDGLYQVVDGVQRLTVINSYMKNEFKLKNLEYLKECEGRWYKKENAKEKDNLQSVYTRRIEQTQLFFNIIDPQTPGKVKYDIFKRINTGGKALNNQEIRNCLANSRTREFLHALSRSDHFIHATRGSISATRMADEELILRFVAFYLIDNQLAAIKEYKGGMDVLLDDTIEILNKTDITLLTQIRKAFLNAMDSSFYLFNDRAFRKSNFINKALFLGVSRVLSRYSLEKIKTKDSNLIRKKMSDEIKNNIDFNNALSMGTNDARNVGIVYDTVEKIIGD